MSLPVAPPLFFRVINGSLDPDDTKALVDSLQGAPEALCAYIRKIFETDINPTSLKNTFEKVRRFYETHSAYILKGNTPELDSVIRAVLESPFLTLEKYDDIYLNPILVAEHSAFLRSCLQRKPPVALTIGIAEKEKILSLSHSSLKKCIENWHSTEVPVLTYETIWEVARVAHHLEDFETLRRCANWLNLRCSRLTTEQQVEVLESASNYEMISLVQLLRERLALQLLKPDSALDNREIALRDRFIELSRIDFPLADEYLQAFDRYIQMNINPRPEFEYNEEVWFLFEAINFFGSKKHRKEAEEYLMQGMFNVILTSEEENGLPIGDKMLIPFSDEIGILEKADKMNCPLISERFKRSIISYLLKDLSFLEGLSCLGTEKQKNRDRFFSMLGGKFGLSPTLSKLVSDILKAAFTPGRKLSLKIDEESVWVILALAVYLELSNAFLAYPDQVRIIESQCLKFIFSKMRSYTLDHLFENFYTATQTYPSGLQELPSELFKECTRRLLLTPSARLSYNKAAFFYYLDKWVLAHRDFFPSEAIVIDLNHPHREDFLPYLKEIYPEVQAITLQNGALTLKEVSILRSLTAVKHLKLNDVELDGNWESLLASPLQSLYIKGEGPPKGFFDLLSKKTPHLTSLSFYFSSSAYTQSKMGNLVLKELEHIEFGVLSRNILLDVMKSIEKHSLRLQTVNISVHNEHPYGSSQYPRLFARIEKLVMNENS